MSSSNQYGRFEFVINGSNQLIVTDLPPTVCLAKNHPQALLYIVVMITCQLHLLYSNRWLIIVSRFFFYGKSFRTFISACEPNFSIPGDEKARTLIHTAYKRSCHQLIELLTTADVINITTDLWTSPTNESFIGVTATWLDDEWKFNEALLSIEVIPSPHTAENIRDILVLR